MKTIMVLLVGLACTGFLHSQNFTKATQGWYGQISAGQLLPYTDISSSNGFRLKENDKMDFGYSCQIGKQWFRGINTGVGIIDGKLSGIKLESADGTAIDQSFNADFWQIQGELKIDFLKFHEITKATGEAFPFDFQVHFGMGSIFYRSTQSVYSTGETIAEYGVGKRENSMIYKYGLGGFVFLNKSISFNMEYSWVQTSTDLLDARQGISNNNDMFGCLFIGFTYHLFGENTSLF